MCVCGGVYVDIKTEQHVVEKSPQTKQIYSNGFATMSEIFQEFHDNVACEIIYKIFFNFVIRGINDIHRISFTRIRVSGHSLAVETGH